MNIGKLVYEVRESRGMSRLEASEGICSDKYIYLIENGHRQPSVKILYNLSIRLKFNFFHTLSYLSDDDPLALKDGINKFIKLRLKNDLEEIKSYIRELISSDHYHKESFIQLVAVHIAYLELMENIISQNTFSKLEEAYSLTCDESIDNIDVKRNHSYTELLIIAIYSICKFTLYKEYNLNNLVTIYNMSKAIIRKDESTDIAMMILRCILSLLEHFDKEDEKGKYVNEFTRDFVENISLSSNTSDNLITKELISANVDLISWRIETINNSSNVGCVKVYFIGEDLVIFKTLGIDKETFTIGLQKYYKIIDQVFENKEYYHLIADLSSFAEANVTATALGLSDDEHAIFSEEREKKRRDTYIVIPKLNQTLLDVLFHINRSLESMNRFEPIVVQTVLDAVLQTQNGPKYL